MYWTDRGDLPQGNSLNRVRFTAAGPGRQELLATGFAGAIGLVLDRVGRRAYVGDLAGTIRAVDLHGEHASRVIATWACSPDLPTSPQ
ncbi:hypothetical protein GCM10009619_41970 [Williamsia maris]